MNIEPQLKLADAPLIAWELQAEAQEEGVVEDVEVTATLRVVARIEKNGLTHQFTRNVPSEGLSIYCRCE